MRRIAIWVAVASVLGAGIAPAEDRPRNSSIEPPAISTSAVDSKTSAAPVPGRNSFTKSEAVRRLAAHGYSSVDSLMLDHNGIWRGTATKGGRQVDVALDYQGNVVER